jgi:hypothetical protein
MYRQLRDLVRKTMNEAHDEYIRQILNDENEGSSQPTLGKKFWKYIKSRKKDSMGISPLQNEKREHVIDSKWKAEILNSQYNSVFTTEDLNNIPDLGHSNTNNIRPLEMTKTGIEKQLKQLNPSKANGPDELPSRILKETHAEISPFLAKVFQQSYDTGQVPADWKQANISAIYKKGDRSQAVNHRQVYQAGWSGRQMFQTAKIA